MVPEWIDDAALQGIQTLVVPTAAALRLAVSGHSCTSRATDSQGILTRRAAYGRSPRHLEVRHHCGRVVLEDVAVVHPHHMQGHHCET